MTEYSDALLDRVVEAVEAVPELWTRVVPANGLDEMVEVGWTPEDEDVVLLRTSSRDEARVARDLLQDRLRVRAALLAVGYREDE